MILIGVSYDHSEQRGKRTPPQTLGTNTAACDIFCCPQDIRSIWLPMRRKRANGIEDFEQPDHRNFVSPRRGAHQPLPVSVHTRNCEVLTVAPPNNGRWFCPHVHVHALRRCLRPKIVLCCPWRAAPGAMRSPRAPTTARCVCGTSATSGWWQRLRIFRRGPSAAAERCSSAGWGKRPW